MSNVIAVDKWAVASTVTRVARFKHLSVPANANGPINREECVNSLRNVGVGRAARVRVAMLGACWYSRERVGFVFSTRVVKVHANSGANKYSFRASPTYFKEENLRFPSYVHARALGGTFKTVVDRISDRL